MKYLPKLIITLLLSLVLTMPIFGKPKSAIKEIWHSEPVFDTPESVCYNSEKQEMYVSNVGGKQPWAKDEHGFISKISPDGTILELKWVDEIDAPKGMAIANGQLYVANIDELIVIDIDTGQKVAKHILTSAISLNDITSDSNGNVYISDADGVKIYRFKEGKIDIFARNFAEAKRINGLHAFDNQLLCATNGKIIQFDLETAEEKTLLTTSGLADGIGILKDSSYVFSYWSGKLYQQKLNEDPVLLLDYQKDKINTADFSYDAESNRIWIPTFFNNRVVCYKFK